MVVTSPVHSPVHGPIQSPKSRFCSYPAYSQGGAVHCTSTYFIICQSGRSPAGNLSSIASDSQDNVWVLQRQPSLITPARTLYGEPSFVPGPCKTSIPDILTQLFTFLNSNTSIERERYILYSTRAKNEIWLRSYS